MRVCVLSTLYPPESLSDRYTGICHSYTANEYSHHLILAALFTPAQKLAKHTRIQHPQACIFFFKPAPADTFGYTSKCRKAKKKTDGHGERQTDRQWGQFPFLLLATRTRSCQRCESDNGEGNAAQWGDLDSNSKHTLAHNS